MDKLPSTIIEQISEYDNTYRVKVGKVLQQLSAHCFIYNCHKCSKPWGNCYCYCLVCKTYLKYCHQKLYGEMGAYEDDLAIIIPLGFKIFFVHLILHCILYDGRSNFNTIKND